MSDVVTCSKKMRHLRLLIFMVRPGSVQVFLTVIRSKTWTRSLKGVMPIEKFFALCSSCCFRELSSFFAATHFQLQQMINNLSTIHQRESAPTPCNSLLRVCNNAHAKGVKLWTQNMLYHTHSPGPQAKKCCTIYRGFQISWATSMLQGLWTWIKRYLPLAQSRAL